MEDQRYNTANYRRMAIVAARELHYSDEVIKRIREATSDDEINIIMYLARTSANERR